MYFAPKLMILEIAKNNIKVRYFLSQTDADSKPVAIIVGVNTNRLLMIEDIFMIFILDFIF